MSKYKSAIEKIIVTDATFKQSTEREIEPSWINFFYGNNGTGKSTISRAIRNGNGLVFGENKTSTDFCFPVFNEDFVKTELNFDSSPIMPGVLMLGKINIEAQQQIDEKNQELERLELQIKNMQKKIEEKQALQSTVKKKLEDSCWEAAARYKKLFGGKGDLRTKELCITRLFRTTPVEHDFNMLKNQFETATDPNAKKYDILSLLDLSKLEGIETYVLLAQPIISTADNVYSRFWQAINATDWVKHGHNNFSVKADGKCPYCRENLPRKFEEQFAACFDSKYAEDCAKIVTFQNKYVSYTSEFIETIRHHIDYIPQGYGNLQEYNLQLEMFKKTVNFNNQMLSTKVEKPSEQITLDSLRPYLEKINGLIEETNGLFNDNNAIFDNKIKKQNTCLTAAWELLAFEMRRAILDYSSNDKAVSGEISKLAEQVKTDQRALNVIKNEIVQLTDTLGSSAATVQKVNDLLLKSGFRGFELKPHRSIPDKYEITRPDGSLAEKLSEGERNFIAFLYFYFYVQGAWKKEDLIKGKIVVIDDPVSSMDSGVLNIVGSLVRTLIDDCFLDGHSYNIKQIFILTHNPYFHKDVSFYRLGDNNYKKVSFFEIKKSYSNISTITPCEKKNSSIDSDNEKENFSPVQNYYTSLWNEYKEVTTATTLLSVMNRIIEYHFVQLCNYSIQDLRNNIRKYIGDDEDKLNLINDILRYIYDNSDNSRDMRDDPYFAAQKSSDEYKSAFKAVFEAMGQGQHYRKMSGEG